MEGVYMSQRMLRRIGCVVGLVAGVSLAWADDPFLAATTALSAGGNRNASAPVVDLAADALELPPMSPELLAEAQALADTKAAGKADATAKAAAENRDSLKTGSALQGLVGGAVWLRAVAAFLFVATLVLLCAAWAKRLLVKAGVVPAEGKSLLHVIQVVPLAGKQRLAVVQFDKTRLLVGLSGQTMTLLCAQNPEATETVAALPTIMTPPTLEDRVAKAVGDSEQGSAAAISGKADLLEQVRGTIRAMKPLTWRGKKNSTI